MDKRLLGSLVIILFLAIYSCSYQPYRQANKSYKRQAKLYAKEVRRTPSLFFTTQNNPLYWIGTTNFNMRKPNFVIIHYTAQNSCEQTLRTFTLPRTQVSAHYVICKDGSVHHMLNDYLRAWHAGIAKWGNLTDINSASVGIEIDNNGFEVFTEPQMKSLFQLLDTLKLKYSIPANNFIGHSDIAPSRKADPGKYFPWKTLADSGYGVWYGDTTNVVVPDSFNSVRALRIIGYDVRDSISAIRAFKTHFLQDTSCILTEADKKVLLEVAERSL
ncbi:N-acetylmuramoyl-L-alanine amidase [Segetibacter koreensis]|uniref:N-acetylmuramoyl-L-alanine amidase n=1 Tax=Segetibacter koreensis TaxID=398037 RepID=UPI0004771ABC|nr:N-acetylmuramoyl-L-alanine amidase [Segetibacter koreensis]